MSDEEIEVIDFGKKKKKDKKEKKEKKDKSKKDDGGSDEECVLVETEYEEGESFTYDDLLTRLHDIIENKHTGLGVREKFTLKPPQVTRATAKKTAWVNFLDICDTLNRPAEHLQQYVFAELGCDGTYAGETGRQFILKGRFYPRNIESLLKRYIREYVMCTMCRSSNTQLTKDQSTRLHKMKCMNCGADRSCTTIKSGFTAIRKGDRRKAKMADSNKQVVG